MKFLQWILLSTILGSPWLALLVLVVVYWTLDRYTLGLLPSPFKLFSRLRRLSTANAQLAANPHDRRARLTKADVLLDLRRPKAAFATIRPNVEAGDHDPHTLFIAGRAAFGAGEFDVGDRLLEAVRKDDAHFSHSRIDLELGRGRLNAGRFAEAKDALERFVATRAATVEGQVLLGRVLSKLGDPAGCKEAYNAAWRAYQEAPSFIKRRERWWAWRAQPMRPISYLAIGALVIGTCLAFFS